VFARICVATYVMGMFTLFPFDHPQFAQPRLEHRFRIFVSDLVGRCKQMDRLTDRQ
jgi:hypothetical protein